ncbi:MAG TPA: glycosyltransferase family 4 protein [Candidatus Saccharimonadales bacterium]|nr:glycosyltransferase family 4 protein [Candidatus Saccharimonadales bacterium]
MRFLMLNWRDLRSPISGGAERVSLAYLTELIRRGHEVCWFAYDFPGAVREEMFDKIKIVRGGGKGTSIWEAKRWYRRQVPFDLVIDQHHGIPWFAPWWCKTNCVAYIHEVLGPIWSSFYSWPISNVGRWQERWTHWLYRDVPFWTPSESTRKILLQHSVRRIHVFPNGISSIPLANLESKPLKPPLQLVVVSRFSPNKRVDHAIKSVKVLLQRGANVHMTLVGAGIEEQKLNQLVQKLGLEERIEFTGQLDEQKKDDQLRHAHLLLHTSVREGWGLNIIEANAMGTPAIVYPVGGLVDSTIHNETGLVTRAETPEAMADSILEVAKSPEKYACLRLNAWNRSKSLQWDQVLPPACDWLESLAAKPFSK